MLLGSTFSRMAQWIIPVFALGHCHTSTWPRHSATGVLSQCISEICRCNTLCLVLTSPQRLHYKLWNSLQLKAEMVMSMNGSKRELDRFKEDKSINGFIFFLLAKENLLIQRQLTSKYQCWEATRSCLCCWLSRATGCPLCEPRMLD